MYGDLLFWLGFVGLLSGIGVGIALLEEEGDPFLRNVMFAICIACAMFIYLAQLGEKTAWDPVLIGVSFFIGGIAALLIALAGQGNLRAAFVAGGMAGLMLQETIKILPPGSFGYTGMHDIPMAIDVLATILVGIGAYYLLRNWGRDGEKWD
jgi:hypothetical protein